MSKAAHIHGCLLTIGLSCSLLMAQEISLEERIYLVKTTLSMLDISAAECLDQLKESRSKNNSRCLDFMASIDGQKTTDLISHCEVIRNWRNDYVENSITSNEAAEIDQILL